LLPLEAPQLLPPLQVQHPPILRKTELRGRQNKTTELLLQRTSTARARNKRRRAASERRDHSCRSQQARTQRRCPRSLLPRWPWPTSPDRKQILKVTLVNLLVTKATISTVSGSLGFKKKRRFLFSKGTVKSKNRWFWLFSNDLLKKLCGYLKFWTVTGSNF
jgi:hypothetical protein